MDYNNKIASAACFLFAKNENGEMCILCGKRSGNDIRHYGGFFDVPVGQSEYGEQPIETAIRELKEEAGISISPTILKFYGYQSWGDGSQRYGANYYAILDKCIKIGKGDFEHDFFKWLPINEIRNYRWAFDMDKITFEIYSQIITKQTLNEFIEKYTKLI